MPCAQLEREVSALQQQQAAAITRLRKSQEEAAEVCQQLQSVVDTLHQSAQSQPELSATCATVQQVSMIPGILTRAVHCNPNHATVHINMWILFNIRYDGACQGR